MWKNIKHLSFLLLVALLIQGNLNTSIAKKGGNGSRVNCKKEARSLIYLQDRVDFYEGIGIQNNCLNEVDSSMYEAAVADLNEQIDLMNLHCRRNLAEHQLIDFDLCQGGGGQGGTLF